MPLLENGKLTEDAFRRIGPDDALPGDAVPVIVPFARWAAEREALLARSGPLGVLLAAGDRVEEIADDLDRLAVVALDFPKFTDGRNYSVARLLRERYGYTGQVRAVGNVLRDQLQFMVRCGINAVEIDGDHPSLADPEAAWAAAMGGIDVWYQRTEDGRPAVWELRRQAAE